MASVPRFHPSAVAAFLLAITLSVSLMLSAGSSSWIPVSAQAVPRPAPGDRLFLKLDGVDGESTESNHTGELAVQSFSWSETHSVDTSTRAQMAAFHIVMRADKATPILVRKAAAREGVSKAVLSIRNSLGQDYMKWTLGDAFVTSFQVEETGGQVKPQVSFDLTFGKIDAEYRPQLYSGGLGPAVKGGWDGKGN